MSYDVYIGDKSFNYTSNTSKLIYDHILDTGKGGGLREIHGKMGWEAVPILAEAFKRLNETRRALYEDGKAGEAQMCAKYDAKNGWGSTVGTILFLGQIMGACAMYPYEVVELSC